MRKGSLRHLIGETSDGASASHTGRHCKHQVDQAGRRAATRLDSERSIALANLQVRRAVTPLHVQGLLEPAGRAGDGPGLQGW